MELRSIMTTRVVTVEVDDTLEVVKQIFDAMKFHHLLVVDTGKTLCGVISDRDLLRALSPYVGTASENARDTATLRKRVHQIMSRKPVTLPPEASRRPTPSTCFSHPGFRVFPSSIRISSPSAS